MRTRHVVQHSCRDLWGLAGALAALVVSLVWLTGTAAAVTTVPVTCPGATLVPVAPGLLDLTGQNEADYLAGRTVLIYGNWGDNPPNPSVKPPPPAGSGDEVPPACSVRLENGTAVAQWSYCTDMHHLSCRNNGSPNFFTLPSNPRFAVENDPLGPAKERVIAHLVKFGYPLAAPGVGNILPTATAADDATSDNRNALQEIVWCVSEAGPGVKTADNSTNPADVAYLGAECAANFTTADFDAVLAATPQLDMITAAPETPAVAAGSPARFTLTTNVFGAPITVSAQGLDGGLSVCGGSATLAGDQLTVSGASVTQPETVTLCGTRGAAGTATIDAKVVPTSQNVGWTWNSRDDCQVYITPYIVPAHLTAMARVDVQAPRAPETPVTPVAPTTPVAPVTPVVKRPAPRLALTKTSAGTRFRVGQRITFTLRLRNPSTRAIRRVTVCDTLPEGLAFVKGTPKVRMSKGRHCWTIRTLRAKATVRLRVVARVLPGARTRLTNRAVATSPNARRATAKRTVRIRLAPVRPGGVTG